MTASAALVHLDAVAGTMARPALARRRLAARRA